MFKKRLIIFIVVFIIVVGVIFYYYYSNKSGGVSNNNSSTSGYNSFNPFGNNNSQNTNQTNGNSVNNANNSTGGQTQTGDTSSTTVTKFHPITNFAVAGAVYFDETRPIAQSGPVVDNTAIVNGKKAATKKALVPKVEVVPALRYVERATGHIYEMYLDNKTEGEISNSTIPGVHDATWDGKAQTVIYRYLADDNKTITSYMASLGKQKGEFLPNNIEDLSISPDKTKFFYLIKTVNGIVGSTRSFSDAKVSQLFNSSYSEWLSQWASTGKIFLTTKPSAQTQGSLFVLNSANDVVTKVFGGVDGLTTLANGDGSLVLYNSSDGISSTLELFNISSHTNQSLNIYSLPEKCIWSSDNINIYCAVPNSMTNGGYPDIWYQGLVSFDDHFIKINTKDGVINQVADSLDETAVDATNLFLNKDESSLFFINKKDSTLWSLDLK